MRVNGTIMMTASKTAFGSLGLLCGMSFLLAACPATFDDGTVSLVAGGVLAAGAITAAVFWPKHSKEVARMTPIAAPGYGGASFTGSF
jgi:hypothetical protein